MDSDWWELRGSYEARGKSGARLQHRPRERAGRVHRHRAVGNGGQPVRTHQQGANPSLKILCTKSNNNSNK